MMAPWNPMPVLLLLLLPALAIASAAKSDIISACTNFCAALEFQGKPDECIVYCVNVISSRLEEMEENDSQDLFDNDDTLASLPYRLNQNEKRQRSSFVRIGRAPRWKQKSNFVRIGRGRGQSSFVRIGRSPDDIKRASAFVRIGKKSDPEAEYLNAMADNAEPVDGDKRASRFYHNGDDLPDKRKSSFVRIGRYYDPFKRKSSFVRIGKSGQDFDRPNRASSFVRIGKASKFVRIGKSDPEQDFVEIPDEEKRASHFVRIGKKENTENDDDDNQFVDEKRASSFVRIGRPSSFVRIGKKDDMDKRKSSFVRIGKKWDDEAEKRASSFVRIGKKDDEDPEKRASSFVRIGKSSLEDSYPEYKRKSSFVRIGKKDDNELPMDVVDSDQAKRARARESFVRIGKKASSFVRIGRSAVDHKDTLDSDNYSTEHLTNNLT